MGWDYAKSRSGDRKVAPIGLVEEDIMNYIADESNRDIGVLAFRGIGKTHIVIAYAAWCLWNDPEMKIVIISKSQGEAKKSLNMLRSLFQDIDFLHHLMPQKGQHDSAEKLQVGPAKSSRQPSVTALGVSGQIPGNRSHLIIADDIEDKENTKTLESRDNLYERTHEFMALGYPGVSRVIVIGTYHNDDSLYMRMAKSGYKFRTWPAEYLDDSDPEIEIEGYAPMLRRHIHEGKVRVGDATCPHRFSKEELKRQRSKGRSHYYRQFLLISNVADALRYPLKLSDFIVHHVDMDMAPTSIMWGERDHNGSTAIEGADMLGQTGDRLHRAAFVDMTTTKPYTQTYMVVDPAGAGDDRVGVTVISELAGRLWVKHVGTLKGGHDPATLAEIAQIARRTRTNYVWVEKNWGGGMYRSQLEPVLQDHFTEGDPENNIKPWSCGVDEFQSRGQKETRIIDAVEPALSGHRIIISKEMLAATPGLSPDHEFAYQMTRITRQPKCLRHDDAIDAFASCVSLFTEDISVSTERAQERYKSTEHVFDGDYRGLGPRMERMFARGNRDARWFRV